MSSAPPSSNTSTEAISIVGGEIMNSTTTTTTTTSWAPIESTEAVFPTPATDTASTQNTIIAILIVVFAVAALALIIYIAYRQAVRGGREHRHRRHKVTVDEEAELPACDGASTTPADVEDGVKTTFSSLRSGLETSKDTTDDVRQHAQEEEEGKDDDEEKDDEDEDEDEEVAAFSTPSTEVTRMAWMSMDDAHRSTERDGRGLRRLSPSSLRPAQALLNTPPITAVATTRTTTTAAPSAYGSQAIVYCYQAHCARECAAAEPAVASAHAVKEGLPANAGRQPTTPVGKDRSEHEGYASKASQPSMGRVIGTQSCHLHRLPTPPPPQACHNSPSAPSPRVRTVQPTATGTLSDPSAHGAPRSDGDRHADMAPQQSDTTDLDADDETARTRAVKTVDDPGAALSTQTSSAPGSPSSTHDLFTHAEDGDRSGFVSSFTSSASALPSLWVVGKPVSLADTTTMSPTAASTTPTSASLHFSTQLAHHHRHHSAAAARARVIAADLASVFHRSNSGDTGNDTMDSTAEVDYRTPDSSAFSPKSHQDHAPSHLAFSECDVSRNFQVLPCVPGDTHNGTHCTENSEEDGEDLNSIEKEALEAQAARDEQHARLSGFMQLYYQQPMNR